MSYSKWTQAILALFTVLGHVHADTLLVERSTTDALTIAGQTVPAQEEEITRWIGKARARIDSGSTSMIIRLDENKMYFINHKRGKYFEAALPLDLKSMVPPQMAQMMDQMPKSTTAVTETDETKQIGKWNCRRYDVVQHGPAGSTRSILWATPEIEIGRAGAMVMALFGKPPGPGVMESAEEYRKIQGYPVLEETTTTVMGVSGKSSREVLSVTALTPPAGTYDPPANYEGFPFTMEALLQFSE